MEGTWTGQVVATAQTQVHDDLKTDLRFPRDYDLAAVGLRSRMTVPISSQGKVIATLVLRHGRAGAYGSREQSLLERLANLIAPAV